jgi:hypothetical protein
MTEDNRQEVPSPPVENPLMAFKENGQPIFFDLDKGITVQLDKNNRIDQVILDSRGTVKFSVDKYGRVWEINFPNCGVINRNCEIPGKREKGFLKKLINRFKKR